jgi:wyosine [tRNA(Phe)-imidazoG37] synthetase (radical SAM superfamily)
VNESNETPSIAFADKDGQVYDFPSLEPAFRTGNRFVRLEEEDLIELPYGSCLFTLPGRYPVFYNHRNNDFNHVAVSPEGDDISAVSAFLASGYLRTYLPAFISDDDAPVLPLWAYSGLSCRNGKFFVPALRIDDDPRSDPAIHDNDRELDHAIKDISERYGENRLIRQLAHCSREYRCLCARNFFLSRHEAPVPTTRACNSGCVGCLSYQDGRTGFEASQQRLDFDPTPEEIFQVISHHFDRVDAAVASFGQGCEGEPLLRAGDIAAAIRLVREKTDVGTLNINTNGSRPDSVRQLIEAGLDSIRISLNSPTEDYYIPYYHPRDYSFSDILHSMEISLEAGIFVSLNLFFLPGFTDMETEVESLLYLLDRYPVNMIQARNLNIDPDYYLRCVGFRESEPMGIMRLLDLLDKRYPRMLIGYYNPPKERFSRTD